MLPVERLKDLTNRNARLVHRGRFLSTSFLLCVGETDYLVHIHRGRIESIDKGPFVMPRAAFSLRASLEDWQAFCQPLPKPGYHDLMALVKHKRLLVAGDQHPFMSHLLYFKAVLEGLRAEAADD